MSWLETILYGLIAGITEILPISSSAHRILILNLNGETSEPALLRLFIHLGILAGLYYSCQSHITRMTRAARLARIPKRRRKRPLDTRSLTDLSILKAMLVPVLLGLLLYNRVTPLYSKLSFVAGFLFFNGLILYLPRYLPGGNRDSLHLSGAEGLLMGLGSVLSILPGISCVGAVTSIGNARGVEKNYALDLALLINIPLTLGFVIFDFVALVSQGVSGLAFTTVLTYIISAGAAFGGIFLGIKVLRSLLKNRSMDMFAYYSLGFALFTFILFLNI